MKKMKNNLDEMQEHKLLNIERNGVWFVFWALLASILIQGAIFREDAIKAVAGEWIVFMTLCVYLVIACLKNGIWDRHLKANKKTNYVISFIAAIVLAVFTGVSNYFKYNDSFKGMIATIVIMFLFTFILCIIALNFTMKIYKKRLKDLENSCEEEDDDVK